MKKSKKVKITLGLFYLIVLSSFLYFMFSKFNFEDISSIKIIQSNIEQLNLIKFNNLISTLLFFSLFTVLWVILLGFGSPIALVGGFIFGKWLGTLIVTVSLSIGALFLYIIGVFFFYDYIKRKFSNKFSYLEKTFKKKELLVMIIFRFVGLVPFSIANLLPVILNIKYQNYFFGTFIGIMPSIFIFSSLGSGIASAIYQFEVTPSFITLLLLPEIYLPICGFVCIFILSLLLKKTLKK